MLIDRQLTDASWSVQDSRSLNLFAYQDGARCEATMATGAWLAQQEQAGVTLSDPERWWLDNMVQIVANSAGIRTEDLDGAP